MSNRNTHATIVGMALVVMMGGLVGCESTDPGDMGGTRRAAPIQDVDGPEWLAKPGIAFSGERQVFYGVGSAAGIQNPTLRRLAAEGGARQELAKNFKLYTAGLLKQYMASTTAGDMTRVSEEQFTVRAMKQVTDGTLVGSRIIEIWEHPRRNETFALARLDLGEFLEVMQKYESAMGQFKELDAKVREFVQKNAQRVHEELNQELEKQAQK